MTTRLLGRWALLLSRCPQALASATRLKAHTALPVEPLWSQAWIQTPVRPLCVDKKYTQKWQHKQNAETQALINKASTTNELLKIWKNLSATCNQAALCLIQLNKLAAEKRMKTDNILKDPLCVELMKAVCSQESMIFPKTLLPLLHALCGLDVSPNSVAFQSVVTETLWRIRRMRIRELCHLVNWAYNYPGYKDANEILTSAALKHLELRWTELGEPRLVIVLMRRVAGHSPLLMDKLEDKALELAELYTAEDIRFMLLFLASQKRRAVPLLRAFSYHLDQKLPSELETPLMLNVIYAYGQLNFQHTPVLQKIAAELFGRLKKLTPKEVSQCSKSLAFLKWFHLPLFEGFAQHFLLKSEDYDTLQLCNLLISFAKLNFQPCNMEEFYKRVHEALEGSWQGLETFLLTDLVWSLCVLQQAKPEHIAALTDPAFQTKLAGVHTELHVSCRMKLLHIATSGQLESLRESSVWPTIHLPASKDIALSPMSLQSSLFAALQSLTESCPTALRTQVDTVYGWTVDAELVVDSDHKPIDLEKLVAPHLPGGGGSEPLPQGAHRMAFLAWEFGHFLSSSKDLLGRFAMQKRHLQLAGFLVVEVPYFEWQELKSDWMKVAYLKDKIGKAVAEERAK